MDDKTNEGTETQEQTEGNAPEGTEGQSTDGNGDKTADLPEWVKKELKEARQDAANYRTRLRETEAKFQGVKTPEEVEALLGEERSKNAALERQIQIRDVAAKHGLPAELAAVLQGDTPEALEEHAKTLAKFAAPAPQEPDNPKGGLDPNSEAESNDPRVLRRLAAGRR